MTITRRSATLCLAAALAAAAAADEPRAAAALAAGGPSAAQFGKLVTDVVVRHAGGPAAADPAGLVLARVSARKNRYVSQGELSRDQRELLGTGAFSDVSVLLENDGDDGVRVVYDVVLAPRFRPPLAISGNSAFGDGKIRASFGLDEGDRVDRARLDALCDKLRAEYRDSYYPGAKVTATLSETDPGGFATVSVLIDEGERTRVSRFEFTGNEALSGRALSALLGRPSAWNPFRALYSSWRKSALDFEHVRDVVSKAYRDLGYLDVSVGEPRLARKTPGSAPAMRVAITEGPRYVIGGLAVDGASAFPAEELLGVVRKTVREGDAASEAALAAAARNLEDFYGRRGYARASAGTSLEPAGEGAAKVTFAIREGVLARIRGVRIRGNTRTRDKVIRRELAVAPGMLYDEVAAERSRARLENLGYFSSVRHDVDVVPGEEKDLGLEYFGDAGVKAVPAADAEAAADVFFDVEEKETGRLMVGVGTSSVDDILGYVEISQNNFDISRWPFTGGGQKARLSLELGTDSRSGELAWTDPWFMDRRQSLSAEMYRREIGFSEYDETRSGGGLSLTEPLKYGRLALRLGGEAVESDEFVPGEYVLRDDPARGFRYDAADDGYLRVPARLTWSYDTRDRPFVPTRGSRNSVFAEIQNGALGADYDNYKIGLDLRQYIPLGGRHVLGLRLRAETIDAYGGSDEIPLNDRLYLGGGRTVRGFRYREVGPKALPAGDATAPAFLSADGAAVRRRPRPVGGRTMAMFSAEYTYRLAENVRLAAWLDAGNVWKDAFDADFGDYAASLGIGVRLDVPGLPIRLDYAFPQRSDDDYSRKERFIFWIGFD